MFAGDAVKRIGLIRLANWFNQNRGLVTACQIIVGDLKQENIDIEKKQLEMERALDKEGLIAFSDVNVVSEYENGVIDVVQANGIANLNSNTVMFGWPTKPDRLESILRIMRAVSRAGKSTIITRLNWAHEPGQEKRIDIWWRGKQFNGDMMLLLAYLLNLNREWRDAKIVVRSIVKNEQNIKKITASLSELIAEARIVAETEVIIKPTNKSIAEVMQTYSRSADMVFLGMMEPKSGEESDYAERMKKLVSGLNTTIFVRNAGKFAGDLI